MSNFLDGGKLDKYLVIKRQDIEECLHPVVIEELDRIIDALNTIKGFHGKKTDNKYLVINTDEPYAPEIVEIMKRNGHWG